GDDPVKALKGGDLKFKMYGKKMFGEWALVHIRGRSRSSKGNEWLLLKHRDQWANDKVDITEVAPRSVISNKLVDEVGSERTWQSNRAASGRKAPTVASALAAKDAKAPKKKVRATKKARTSSAPRSRKAPSRAASAPSQSSRAR